MWLPSYMYYLVCPRASKFADCIPAMLHEDLEREGMRLDPDGTMPRKTPLIEIKVLTCRRIASVSKSLGATQETIASITLKDPDSGLAVGTAICIGLTSPSLVRGRSRMNRPVPVARPLFRGPSNGLATTNAAPNHASKQAAWAGRVKPDRGYSAILYTAASAPR